MIMYLLPMTCMSGVRASDLSLRFSGSGRRFEHVNASLHG
jgi:hypothetical protein